MSYLDELESQSIYIIREAYYRYKHNLALLWSMGKDSTTLLHLVRKAFFGNVPIPVIHIDTGFKFRQMYEYRDKYTSKWKLKTIIIKNDKARKDKISPVSGKFECCNALKTIALSDSVRRLKLKALMVGIRRDEHSIRAKERFFSIRDENSSWNYMNQPAELWMEYYKTVVNSGAHYRIHPILAWREIDVWSYIKRERIPVVSLYFAKSKRRYRSIGCECCCEPVNSSANTINKIIQEIDKSKAGERDGRAQDKEQEYMMQKLRSLGYM
ncbi:MAG: sulfate adenylyltransferase subunit CysD [Candidatus Omnitrophota bacterium]